MQDSTNINVTAMPTGEAALMKETNAHGELVRLRARLEEIKTSALRLPEFIRGPQPVATVEEVLDDGQDLISVLRICHSLLTSIESGINEIDNHLRIPDLV